MSNNTLSALLRKAAKDGLKQGRFCYYRKEDDSFCAIGALGYEAGARPKLVTNDWGEPNSPFMNPVDIVQAIRTVTGVDIESLSDEVGRVLKDWIFDMNDQEGLTFEQIAARLEEKGL
jgi:hypothetical protein